MYIVPPARGSLESAETFISEARGGALSFPGFNGKSVWAHIWAKMRLYLVFFMQLLRTVQTERGLCCYMMLFKGVIDHFRYVFLFFLHSLLVELYRHEIHLAIMYNILVSNKKRTEIFPKLLA